MRPRRPDTFTLTLPDGKQVRCWRKERELIRADVNRTGNVMLRQNPETLVYERIDPASTTAAVLKPTARRIG